MEGKRWNQCPWPPPQAGQGCRTERSALSKNCLQSGLQSCQDRSYSRRECQQEGQGPRSWQTAPSLIPDQAPGPSADCEEMTVSKTPDSSTSKVLPPFLLSTASPCPPRFKLLPGPAHSSSLSTCRVPATVHTQRSPIPLNSYVQMLPTSTHEKIAQNGKVTKPVSG